MKGYIYILANSSMPDVLKIARTINDPKDRANDLFQGTTGLPTPFIVLYHEEFEDCEDIEK